jgi:23S rRNA (guanosine2251-2'-O)-methyltransferase
MVGPDLELLYGRNGVLEALRGHRSHRQLIVAAGIKEDARVQEALSLSRLHGIPIERVERQTIDSFTSNANHQGIALATSPFPYSSLDEIVDRPGTILVLDHVQDPQNVGTLLRAAEAAGASGIVIPQDRAAEITPAVVNASAGAVEHLRVSRQPNVARALDRLKEAGWWAVALDSGQDARDLFTTELPQPTALVVGAEAAGIARLVRKTCDLVVEIPMTGHVASLNAATAGSIALFELVRRNRQASR